MKICASIGCGTSLDGRRRDARFCSGRCRLRAQRLLAELGFELADWTIRSERFWQGMHSLQHRRSGTAEERDRARQATRGQR